jgi:hypothetical protein
MSYQSNLSGHLRQHTEHTSTSLGSPDLSSAYLLQSPLPFKKVPRDLAALLCQQTFGGHLSANCGRVFIVGGGFSFYAGLPLTSDFTRALLAARDPHSTSGTLVRHLKKFVNLTFGPTLSSSDNWPSLEDLFTCVDLAANSGHNLGNKYSAADLRTVRRCLIVRIIRMLHNRHHNTFYRKNKEWKLLKQFLSEVDYDSSAFLSMNWDSVIEERFLSVHSQKNTRVDYGCDAIQGKVSSDKRHLSPVPDGTGPTLRIAKIHGSVNWLYCDNCQSVFWLRPLQSLSLSRRLLSKSEWRKVAPSERHRSDPWKCPFCKTVSLSTRLATFSYRKALDFPMFQRSWSTSQDLLRSAGTWAFIGYSLPPADYEFKFLLKRIQLSRQTPPRIVFVTGGADADATYRNYQGFFGDGFKEGTNCFLDGLNAKSMKGLLQY